MKLLQELITLAIGRARPLWQLVKPMVVQFAVELALEALFVILFRPVSPSTEVVVQG